MVLLEGIPDDPELDIDPEDGSLAQCTLRGKLWKIFLSLDTIPAQSYIDLVSRQASSQASKIENDVYRTFRTDARFQRLVQNGSLTRVLNAIAHKHGPSGISYVQGLNVIAGLFLLTMPELDAFHALSQLLTRFCPLYFNGSLDGARAGAKLLDEFLECVDPQLYHHLSHHGLYAEIYAFPSILSFCACTPPVDEVLRLWDAYLSFGLHLNISCCVAQVIGIRDILLNDESPMKHLRKLPDINARLVLSLAIPLLLQIPTDLYQRLTNHFYAHV